ncbi:MAG: hypothetical protein CM15mP74_09890 [Halieaceae bacterium]|nr:MAG: hypothetical protein CM15mP74_09890 [Halieaceae bacterium]
MVSRAPCPQAEPDGYVEYISVMACLLPSGRCSGRLARAWFKPRFVGLENLPEEPALFIGNHAFMAIDAALFHLYLYYDHGRYVKGLGDKSLFANPYYAAVAHAMGGVSGQAAIVERLMARGDDLLLYPGGAYESVKPPKRAISCSGSSAMVSSGWQRARATPWCRSHQWGLTNTMITQSLQNPW